MMEKTQECKVAFIGAGYMAREHLRAFADLDGVLLSGIFSRTRARAETLAREFGIKSVCASIGELASETAANLLVVTVNAPFVADTVMECLKYPWTILAEKPVGLSPEEAEAVQAAADRSGNTVLVALNRRFYEASRYLRSELAGMDAPRFVEIFDQQEPDTLRKMGKHALEVERLMFSNSIHTIDYASFLCRGELLQVRQLRPWQGEGSWLVAAACEYSSGDLMTYRCFWNGPGPWAVMLNCGDTRWELRPLESISRQVKGSRKMELLELSGIDQAYKPGLMIQAEEAVKAALGQPNDSVSIAQAVKTMRLIDRIYFNSADHSQKG